MSLVALGVGLGIGLRQGGADEADLASEPNENLDRRRAEVHRRVNRSWRFRLRRRRKKVAQLTKEVERLREAVDALSVDESDQADHASAVEETEERRRSVQSLSDRAANAESATAALRQALVDGLLSAAQVEREPFIGSLSARIIEHEEARGLRRDRELRQNLEMDSEESARRLIIGAANRYAESHAVERLRSSLRVDEEAKRRAIYALNPLLEEELQAKVEPSERDNVLSIRVADPFVKELCQRLVLDTDPKQFARRRGVVEEGMRREAAACSQQAIDQLGVGEITGERRRLLDRLRFRHSHRQNQWRHAAEVGFLSGMLAWELGLDASVARRGGLMHDIGKSMTHEVEGGHALLGAEVARSEDECPRVASCIGAHHGDEPPIGSEPLLVAAGDAMSGARPGARVQGGEHHETLVRELERIGRSPRRVETAFTVRGGRELRVMLASEDRQGRRVRISPEEMAKLAASMKAQIEDELTYPGTIDVTVIRRVVAEVTAR